MPTTVVVGPDKAIYVGEFTGFPFASDAARIWRVVPGEAPTVYAAGFTNIIDIAFGPDGTLYVLEMAVAGLLAAEQTGFAGALRALHPDGSVAEIPTEGSLVAPGGLVVSGGFAYVTNGSVFPGGGEVLRIPLP